MTSGHAATHSECRGAPDQSRRDCRFGTNYIPDLFRGSRLCRPQPLYGPRRRPEPGAGRLRPARRARGPVLTRVFKSFAEAIGYALGTKPRAWRLSATATPRVLESFQGSRLARGPGRFCNAWQSGRVVGAGSSAAAVRAEHERDPTSGRLPVRRYARPPSRCGLGFRASSVRESRERSSWSRPLREWLAGESGFTIARRSADSVIEKVADCRYERRRPFDPRHVADVFEYL